MLVLLLAESGGEESPTRGEVVRGLADAGYSVSARGSAAGALAELEGSAVDLLLLDASAARPGPAIDLLRQVRARSEVPVIVLSGARDDPPQLDFFDAGADDCIAHPVDVAELTRRVRAVLRRRDRHEEELRGPLGVVLRARAHQVLVDGIEVPLTPREYDVLQLLLERRGEVLSADAISVAVWGYETFGSRNFVEAHISRLRAKLGRAGARDVVATMRGVGYAIR
ncbi:MAG: response regulator transcription factor [Chloroflexi bacterium]|nr:response regulator transcription factor [Chloroflexota bacterium]